MVSGIETGRWTGIYSCFLSCLQVDNFFRQMYDTIKMVIRNAINVIFCILQ